MADNTLKIEMTVADGQNFLQFMKAATAPVNRLNKAVGQLADTLDRIDSKSGGVGSLRKISKEFLDVVDMFARSESLGRRNLENLSRTASTMAKFMDTAKQLNNSVKSGDFNNIKKFSKVMSSIGSAFAELDKIKRPANLVVIQNAVDALIKILKIMENAIPRSGRFSKFSRVRQLFKNLADALSAFDVIKSPKNMQYATAGILVLERTLQLLGKFNFNIIDRISRARKLGQLENVAKSIAKTLSAFDKIKNVGNLERITPAINSLTRIITALSNMSSMGQKLASGGLFSFRQKGTLLEGFSTFTKKLSKAIVPLTKFNSKQMKSLESASQMFNALISLLRLFGQESDVMLRGGDVIADFSSKDIDTRQFKEVIDQLVDIAQYISKARFDPNKVLALGSLFDAFGKLGNVSGLGGVSGGLRGGGIFASLKSMASTAISSTISILRAGARTIGDIFNRIFINNPFTNLIRHAQQTIGQISQSMRSFGRELSQTGMQLLATGGVAGFIQSRQVGMVMDFEAIMKQIEVLGQVTGDELRGAEQLILQLGESSVFSATEVAAAFLDLSKAGLSVEDISLSMEDMLNLAAAGGISVEEASNLVIRAVGAMGLSFEDATMIADTFVAAANVGTATVEQLANAFGYVANTAHIFGQELPQVTAALSLLMDKGIPDERAGTSLDAFLRSMIKPSGPAKEAITAVSTALREMEEESGVLTDLGVSFEGDLAGLTTDAQGNYRDLNEIIKLITIATKDWTEEERANTLSIMAGSSNAGRALLALLGQYEDGTFVIDSYLQKQEESASAASVGAALMDTTRGALEEMSGAFETLLIKALTPVIEYGIRPLIDGMTVLIRLISQLPQPVLSGVAAFVGLSTVLITITGGFMLFSGIITQLIGFGLVPLVGVLWSLTNPLKVILALTAGKGLIIGLLGTGLFVVLPIILTLINAFKQFKDGLEGLAKTTSGNSILGSLSDSFERLKTALSSVFGAFGRFVDILWQITSPTSNGENTGLVAFIIMQITRLMNVASDAIEPIADLFNMLSGFAFVKIPGVSEVVSSVTGGGGSFGLGNIVDMVAKESASFGDSLAAFEQVKKGIALSSYNYSEDIANARKAFESGMFGKAADDIKDFFTFGGGTPSKTTKTVTTMTKQLRSLDDVLRMLDEDSNAFKTLSANLDPFTDNPIIEFLFGKDVTGADLAKTLAQVVTTLSNLRTVGSNTLRTFAQFFADIRDGVGTMQAFKNLIKGLLVDAGQLASVLLDVATSLLGIEGFDDVIANLAQGNLKGALIAFAEQMVNILIDTVKSMLGTLADILVWSWNTLLDFAQDVDWSARWNDLVTGLTAIVNVTSGVVKWSWKKMVTFYSDIDWGNVWDEIKPSVDDLITDKIVIPVADLLEIQLPTRKIESDSIIPLEVVDRESVFGVVSQITETLMDLADTVVEAITNMINALSGPGVAIISNTINDITSALNALLGTDFASLTVGLGALGVVIGYVFGPAVATFAATAATTILPIIALFAAFRGLAKAIPELVDSFNKLKSGDAKGALQSWVDANKTAWDGFRSTIMEILDFIATVFGFEGVFTEEKWQEGLAAWGNLLDSVYALFLEKVALPIAEALADIFSTKQTILGQEISIDVGDFGAQGIRDKLAELTKTEPITVEVVPLLAAPMTDQNTDWDQWMRLAQGEDASIGGGSTASWLPAESLIDPIDILKELDPIINPPVSLIPANKVFDSEGVRNELAMLTTDTGTASIMSMLTGKPDGTAITGPDVFNVPQIQADAQTAEDAVGVFANNSVSNMQLLRYEITGASTDLSKLLAVLLLFDMDVLRAGAGQLSAGEQGPLPEGRAKGGPVTRGSLYRIIENGMPELLQSGNDTFLIPGKNGTVIPMEGSSGSRSLIRNDEYRPRSSGGYYDGGSSYADNSTTTIQINGSSLSMEQLEVVASNLIRRSNTERARSVRRRLRAKGRG